MVKGSGQVMMVITAIRAHGQKIDTTDMVSAFEIADLSLGIFIDHGQKMVGNFQEGLRHGQLTIYYQG